MSPNMTRCEECGKLFAAAPGKTLCETCQRAQMSLAERVREAVEHEGLETPEEIALTVGVPLDDARTLLSQIVLPKKSVNPDALCARCKQSEASQGFAYCAACRAYLDQQFGAAARSIEERLAQSDRRNNRPAGTGGSRMATREALEKKRLRTSQQTKRPSRG
jgi:ribosomal protein L44E